MLSIHRSSIETITTMIMVEDTTKASLDESGSEKAFQMLTRRVSRCDEQDASGRMVVSSGCGVSFRKTPALLTLLYSRDAATS